MEGRGRVYFCGVTMVLGKKGKGREGEELTPSLPPLMPSPYVQQYGIPAKSRYIRSGVCTNLHNSRLINGNRMHVHVTMSQC